MSNDLIKSMKEKVVTFENELFSSLSILTIMENELNSICNLRESWVNEVSGLDEIEVFTFKNRCEVLRKRSEVIMIEMQMDAIHLNGFYEAQQLKQLVVATRPREPGESNKDREKEVMALIKNGMEEICQAAKHSLKLRTGLLAECEAIHRQLSMLKVDYKTSHRVRLEQGVQRVQQYMEQLEENLHSAEEKHKQLTSDYLILRHNARVAKEILVRSQNEAHKVREVLQDKIARLALESHAQTERLEKNMGEEHRILTNDIRRAVIQKEREYEDIVLRVNRKKKEAKRTSSEHKILVAQYDAKYDDLQSKRKTEIRVISKELRKLREMIAGLEVQFHGNSAQLQISHVVSLLDSLNHIHPKPVTI